MSDSIEKIIASSTSSIGNIDSSIGNLIVFRYLVKTERSLLKSFNNPNDLRNIEPKKYICSLIQLLAHKLGYVQKGKMPENPTILDSELKKLNEGDLNKFSNLFIEHHDYLFREQSWNDRTKDGKKTSVYTLGDTIHSKRSDEQWYEYLFRLLCIQQDEQHKKYDEITKNMGITNMSSVLGDQFNSLSSMGATIDNALNSLSSSQAALVNDSLSEPIFTSRLKLDLPEPVDLLPSTESLFAEIQARNEQTEERMREQHKLNKQQAQSIGELVDVSKGMSSYLQKLNESQVQSAEENAAATVKSLQVSKNSNLIAKKGLNTNYLVLILTFMTLFYSIWINNSSTENSEKYTDSFNSLNSTLSKGNTQQAELLLKILESNLSNSDLVLENQVLSRKVESLQQQVSELSALVHSQKLENEQTK